MNIPIWRWRWFSSIAGICEPSLKGDSRDPQQWDPLMGSFPYYSHTTPIRIPKDMGMVWEAYHKGGPIVGGPWKIPWFPRWLKGYDRQMAGMFIRIHPVEANNLFEPWPPWPSQNQRFERWPPVTIGRGLLTSMIRSLSYRFALSWSRIYVCNMHDIYIYTCFSKLLHLHLLQMIFVPPFFQPLNQKSTEATCGLF